jgi:uncharacterized protein YozE (UPF0346 family)
MELFRVGWKFPVQKILEAEFRNISMMEKQSHTYMVSKRGDLMGKSFYHYMMKYREEPPRDDISRLANHIFLDHSFPKKSDDYHEISNYLEMNGDYLKSMSIFDDAWELYTQDERIN